MPLHNGARNHTDLHRPVSLVPRPTPQQRMDYITATWVLPRSGDVIHPLLWRGSGYETIVRYVGMLLTEISTSFNIWCMMLQTVGLHNTVHALSR